MTHDYCNFQALRTPFTHLILKIKKMYTSRNYELKHQISSKGASESWGWKLSMRDKKKTWCHLLSISNFGLWRNWWNWANCTCVIFAFCLLVLSYFLKLFVSCLKVIVCSGKFRKRPGLVWVFQHTEVLKSHIALLSCESWQGILVVEIRGWHGLRNYHQE